MLAVPRAKVVRGFSMFGASYVYDDLRGRHRHLLGASRVLEYLSTAAGRLPQGVAPQIGPDATGVGWVPVRAARPRHEPGRRAACRTGTCATSSPRRMAWPRSPASAASCASTRSPSIRLTWRATASRSTKVTQAIRASTATSAAGGGARREGIHGARARLPAQVDDIARHRAEGRARHPGAGGRRRPRRTGARPSGAASPNSTARARSPPAS